VDQFLPLDKTSDLAMGPAHRYPSDVWCLLKHHHKKNSHVNKPVGAVATIYDL
jgi:hypothetical protein